MSIGGGFPIASWLVSFVINTTRVPFFCLVFSTCRLLFSLGEIAVEHVRMVALNPLDNTTAESIWL